MTEQPKTPQVKIGDIVRLHTAQQPVDDPTEHADLEAYYIAAIVTMTPQQWAPGYRTDDGEWHPTTDVEQPRAGTVHLSAFLAPGSTAPPVQQFAHCEYGENKDCWTLL